jgi:hypothetical protein
MGMHEITSIGVPSLGPGIMAWKFPLLPSSNLCPTLAYDTQVLMISHWHGYPRKKKENFPLS